MILILIVFLMLAGILTGLFVFSREKSSKLLKICGRVQQISTIMLLFVMGLWLGGNPEFWSNIKMTGLYGLLFAIASIAGSVLVVFFLSKPLAGREKK